ncbi:MAG: late competence development ComFB family protein [Leptolyngbyaceae cyanobacterium SM2_3_12]|nr:late competence development ComFB family protein [Leptolyngbyaceae cyanobacterium SM2_3_12]
MKIVHEVPKRAYVNVMELLVAEEVARQTEGLSPRVLKYLKGVEVETYALNRLPALYASSEKGWQHQYEKAKRELHNQIKSAVRQAFAAVQVDPIRVSEPLQISDDEIASGALEALREMLKQPDLSWDGIIHRLRIMLNARTDQNPSQSAVAAEASHRSRYRNSGMDSATSENSQDIHGVHWRPGTYGSEVSWQKSHKPRQTEPEFDWNDPRYAK